MRIRVFAPARVFPCGRRWVVGAVLLSAGIAGGRAAETMVDSMPGLIARLSHAEPGDTIVVKNGVYTTNATIPVRRPGTAERPITIMAESVGGVEIGGAYGLSIAQPAAHVVVRGFTFTHAAGRATIGAGTRHVRFTRNTFECAGEGHYLSVVGDDAEVDYNEFRNKKTVGNMVSVTGTGNQVARRVWIHHNHFHGFTNARAPGAEALRIGLSTQSLSTGGAVVEHNLFVRCVGESQLISNRSSGNTYRYNTILDSPGTQLSLRHGNDCAVYGNYLRNTEGLRIFGDRHLVHSNYLEGNYIGINLGNGSTEVADGGSVSGHDRPDDCIIVLNTLVNNRTHYQLSRRTPAALGATNTVFAHNILLGGGTAAKIEGPYAGGQWRGNILWDTAPGDLPREGYLRADPLLQTDDSGVQRPAAGSPAIDAVTDEYAQIKVDLDGQPRSGKWDIGADELSTAAATARLLAPADVGPAAGLERPAPQPDVP